MTKVSFTWSTRREGNNGYVLEKSGTGIAREYGPMPPHIVPAFVEGRRRIVAEMAERSGLDYVPTESGEHIDFNYLLDGIAKPN